MSNDILTFTYGAFAFEPFSKKLTIFMSSCVKHLYMFYINTISVMKPDEKNISFISLCHWC